MGAGGKRMPHREARANTAVRWVLGAVNPPAAMSARVSAAPTISVALPVLACFGDPCCPSLTAPFTGQRTRGDLGRLCPRAHGVARHASSVDMSRNDADFGCPGLRAPREVSKLGHLPAREPGAGARGA